MAREIAAIPAALEQARQRFDRWRRTRRSRRARIPAALWATAVTSARHHGLYATSRTLRLDYAVLKRRLQVARDQPQDQPAGDLILANDSHAAGAAGRVDVR